MTTGMITSTDVTNISLPNKALSVINAGTMTINVTANVVAMATLVSDSYLRNCWIDRSCGREREREREGKDGVCLSLISGCSAVSSGFCAD